MPYGSKSMVLAVEIQLNAFLGGILTGVFSRNNSMIKAELMMEQVIFFKEF